MSLDIFGGSESLESAIPTDISILREHQQALYTLLEEFDRVCGELKISYVLFAGTLLGAVRHQGFIPWDDDLDVLMLRPDYERFLAKADSVLNRERFYLQREYTEHWPMFFSKLRMNGTTCLEKYYPKDEKTHQGIYIDLFPCDNAAGSVWGRKIQFLASKVVISKSLAKRGYVADSLVKKLAMAVCGLLPQKPFLNLVKGPQRDTDLVHVFLGGGASYHKSVFDRGYVVDRQRAAFERGSFLIPKEYDLLLRKMYGDYMELPSPEKRLIKQHAILVDLHNSYEKYAGYRDGMKFEVHTRSIR